MKYSHLGVCFKDVTTEHTNVYLWYRQKESIQGREESWSSYCCSFFVSWSYHNDTWGNLGRVRLAISHLSSSAPASLWSSVLHCQHDPLWHWEGDSKGPFYLAKPALLAVSFLSEIGWYQHEGREGEAGKLDVSLWAEIMDIKIFICWEITLRKSINLISPFVSFLITCRSSNSYFLP